MRSLWRSPARFHSLKRRFTNGVGFNVTTLANPGPSLPLDFMDRPDPKDSEDSSGPKALKYVTVRRNERPLKVEKPIVDWLRNNPDKSQAECRRWAAKELNCNVCFTTMVAIARKAGRERKTHWPDDEISRIKTYCSENPHKSNKEVKQALDATLPLYAINLYRRKLGIEASKDAVKKQIIAYWKENPSLRAGEVQVWAAETLDVRRSTTTLYDYAKSENLPSEKGPRKLNKRDRLAEVKESVVKFVEANSDLPLEKALERVEETMGIKVTRRQLKYWQRAVLSSEPSKKDE